MDEQKVKELREALEVLAEALKEPAGGSYWPARAYLDKHTKYHDNLEGVRVLNEVVLTALALLQPEPGARPQGTCDLVSQPHPANHCGKAWRPVCKCGHGFFNHATESDSACLVGDCDCKQYSISSPARAAAPASQPLSEAYEHAAQICEYQQKFYNTGQIDAMAFNALKIAAEKIRRAALSTQPPAMRTLGLMDGTDWKYDHTRDRAWIDGREFAPVATQPPAPGRTSPKMKSFKTGEQ